MSFHYCKCLKFDFWLHPPMNLGTFSCMTLYSPLLLKVWMSPIRLWLLIFKAAKVGMNSWVNSSIVFSHFHLLFSSPPCWLPLVLTSTVAVNLGWAWLKIQCRHHSTSFSWGQASNLWRDIIIRTHCHHHYVEDLYHLFRVGFLRVLLFHSTLVATLFSVISQSCTFSATLF